MLQDLRFRLRALFRKGAMDQELGEELRFHFRARWRSTGSPAWMRTQPGGRPAWLLARLSGPGMSAMTHVGLTSWKPRYRMSGMGFARCGIILGSLALPGLRWR